MKGSMTVEAVFVMSLVLLVILWILKTAIEMYQLSVGIAALEWLEPQETADTFRNLELFRAVSGLGGE